MTAWLSIFVLIVGLLLWALPAPSLVKDAGRIMFACGLFWTLAMTAHSSVSLLR
jgi:hypothetical protein